MHNGPDMEWGGVTVGCKPDVEWGHKPYFQRKLHPFYFQPRALVAITWGLSRRNEKDQFGVK